MLSLESPRWELLSHAYGAATDVPTMLRDLQHPTESVSAKAWQEVWSSLCHQGTVYTATYAAVPHIVDVATRSSTTDPKRAECLIFVGAVVKSADAAAIPDDLAAAYAEALMRAEPLVVAAIDDRRASEETIVYLLQALAALHGCIRTAELIEGFVHGEFIPRCPAGSCGAEMYVWIEGSRMFATLEDPATERVRTRTELVPPRHRTGETGAWSDDAVLPLLVEIADRFGHRDLSTKLALWDGTVTCPKCHEPFVLRATLLDPTER